MSWWIRYCFFIFFLSSALQIVTFPSSTTTRPVPFSVRLVPGECARAAARFGPPPGQSVGTSLGLVNNGPFYFPGPLILHHRLARSQIHGVRRRIAKPWQSAGSKRTRLKQRPPQRRQQQRRYQATSARPSLRQSTPVREATPPQRRRRARRKSSAVPCAPRQWSSRLPRRAAMSRAISAGRTARRPSSNARRATARLRRSSSKCNTFERVRHRMPWPAFPLLSWCKGQALSSDTAYTGKCALGLRLGYMSKRGKGDGKGFAR